MRFIFKTHYDQDIAIVKHGGQAFWYALLMVAMAAAPWLVGDYWMTQLSFILIYSIAGLGLMVLAGFTGLASLGHAAFLGVGAYCHAFALKKAGIGLQQERLEGAEVWLLPNPSGLNANYQLPELVKLFRQLWRRSSKNRSGGKS